MAENSRIEWTDHTWNGWWGCTHVHPGCTNCYAELLAKRVGKEWGPSAPRYMTGSQVWNAPLKWNAAAKKAGVRARVFASSMCDIFEDNDRQVCDWQKRPLWRVGAIGNPPYVTHSLAPSDHKPLRLADLRREMFRLIDRTPHLDWLLLTKRPENARRMWPEIQAAGNLDPIASSPYGSSMRNHRPNVWLGTSISDQATADAMVPELLKCRELAPVLFLSIEPLLGDVNLMNVQRSDGWTIDVLQGIYSRQHDEGVDHPGAIEEYGNGPSIDWAIAGCESRGKRAGRFAEGYTGAARSIIQQCQAAGVPVFHKQMPIDGRVSHDMDEWPTDLRVRQFPSPVSCPLSPASP